MLTCSFLPQPSSVAPLATVPPLTFPAGPEAAREALVSISAWPQYAPTPLLTLPGMAKKLGCGKLLYKQESERFGLGSFKALGGAYAVQRLLTRLITEGRGETPSTADLFSGKYIAITKTITVCCATDGNHGKSVAWGASQLGCKSVIFVHETVTPLRAEAIAALGATVIRVPGNYDDAVRHAQKEATAKGWFVVSDTSYPGYTEIPGWIMQGYSVIGKEARDQMAPVTPTHIFLQAGVGGFAASIMTYFALSADGTRPRIIVVEPETAACLLASSEADMVTAVTGDLETIMAGLACGEPSEIAWPAIHALSSAYIAIDDESVRETMRALAAGEAGDLPVVAGESGAAGLAGLREIMSQSELRTTLGLSDDSVVLVIGSEGATDPEMYRQIVGRDACEILV
ncbi:MAG: diaminopropionate ammonia-lyase [Acetobacter sp.]|nr:diaminopropionate ammonia-lyase [Acetobacter sp.]MCH4061982.1 diaminopropionate ammonia-lyase [Acetobacter sp.]MCH4089169.1 diaminopropionate ammonia-lyase [Acetobacter sp.]MCI1293659.1 diaminopropionate ammonia-lyase [Acetobacter sp.]MCI1320260.1 diaminopropionate ammonia-lyase [Acetobacter sp.]